MLAALPHRARYNFVTFVSTRPRLYYGIRRLSSRTDPLCIGRDTEIVIEGYPRSANSTTVYGFLDRQPKAVRVAHHKHHAAQLLRAVEWAIPAVLLVRAPRQAAISNLALAAEARERSGDAKKPGLEEVDVIRSWVAFYHAVLPVLDRLVIAPFEEVTSDIGPMIRAVNTRFGADFAHAPVTETGASALGWHATPNLLRARIKSEIEAGFDSALASSPRLRALDSASQTLHERILEHHERSR